MKTHVYTGPSLAPEAVLSLFPSCRVYPPVARGDLPTNESIQTGDFVLLIDGYFGQQPSVAHYEIIDLLEKNIRVFGVSSMGALRAAELCPIGMIGFGLVYEMFLSGLIDGDDEVALLHDPVSFESVTLPLVNIRVALQRFCRQKKLSVSSAQRIVDELEALWFGERTRDKITETVEKFCSPPESRFVLDHIFTPDYDQKRIDALLALGALADLTFGPNRRGPFPMTLMRERAKTVTRENALSQEPKDAQTIPHFADVTESPEKAPFLQLLHGAASDRRFYRLVGAPEPAICMQYTAWEGGYGGTPGDWLSVHSLLLPLGIPLPKILAVDKGHARVWIEDLGSFSLKDQMLCRAKTLIANCAESQFTLNLYKKALSLLVRAQYPAIPMPASHPVRSRSFDAEKLSAELFAFVDYFLVDFLSLTVKREEGPFAALFGEIRELSECLSSVERVFCHRDYHSENLLLKDNILYWIDFQDARLGPHSYDVVSLLRDSYVDLSWSVRDLLFLDYLDKVNAARKNLSLSPISEDVFFQEALFMGLQRNVKALASFAYVAVHKNKKNYLGFVQNTLKTLLSPKAQSYKDTDLRIRFPCLSNLLQSLFSGDLSSLLRKKIEEQQ